MKTTIRKIAQLAGVSRGTVDKVVHGRTGVSDEVRAAVQRLIDELGYELPKRQKETGALEQVQIAVIIPRLSNPFFEIVKRGMDSALVHFHDRNVQVEYFFCDGVNVNEVLSILDYIEEHGVDGIVLRGGQSGRLCDRLNRFADKNIPVVLYDSDMPGCRRLCMVGEDSRASGRVAASLLAKSIGGQGDVAIIGGLPDMLAHRARLQGFEQAIRERYPNIRIVETINSRDQSVIAYEKTGMLVQQYPNLRGIFSVVGCTGDIGQALIDRQAKNVKIVCYNFTDDVVALVKRGIVDFTIGLTPYRQGSVALHTLLKYLLDGEKPAAPFLEMPILIGIDENIEVLSANQSL